MSSLRMRGSRINYSGFLSTLTHCKNSVLLTQIAHIRARRGGNQHPLKFSIKKGAAFQPAAPLLKQQKNYSFFDYRVNEALHMTDEEHDMLVSLMRQIRDELKNRHDELQDAIIVGYIGLVLNFCQRFYNRQFLTRKLENSDILMKFDSLLQDYYGTNRQLIDGLPTVQYCADQFCMSANYFGDLIKKTTGDTAGNYIRQYVIQRAQNALAAGASIAQVAGELGFEYPQHLSRMFKKQTGITPTEYCERFRHG